MGTKSKLSSKQNLNKTVETALKLVLSGKGIPVNCRNFRLTNAASIKLFDRVTEALKLMGIPYENNYGYEIHVLNERQLEERQVFKYQETYTRLKRSVEVDFASALRGGTAVSKVSHDPINGIKVESVIIDDFYKELP